MSIIEPAENPSYYRAGVFRWIAPFYDVLFGMAFLPLGGQQKVRQGLVDFSGAGPGEHVLDLFCGTGSLTSLIAAKVGRSGLVVGVDLSPAMLQVAARRAKSMPWVSFKRANAESLPFPNGAFDKVFASYGLHEIPSVSRDRALSEIRRCLKPGGGLYVLELGLPERAIPRLLFKLFVSTVEEEPGREMVLKGELLPGMKRAGFEIARLKRLFGGASIMVHASPLPVHPSQ